MNFGCMFNCHRWDYRSAYDVTAGYEDDDGGRFGGRITMVFCRRCHMTKYLYVSMVRVMRP
jgi:hypothetical protein